MRFLEILALQHLLHGDAGVELDDLGEGHLVEPLAVEDNLGAGPVEDAEGLIGVGLRVREDLVAGEGRAGFRATGGVADLGGEVADDEDGLVPELLELAQFLEDDAVTEMEVGGGGVDAELGAERGAAFELLEQFALAENAGGAAVRSWSCSAGDFMAWTGRAVKNMPRGASSSAKAENGGRHGNQASSRPEPDSFPFSPTGSPNFSR